MAALGCSIYMAVERGMEEEGPLCDKENTGK